ncbi:MAG: flagellar filament outer layer protein FlaA [Treponema sp.]|nr:flagellar filament outer layer protein FlaA [Treponema sp.]
MKYDSFKVFWLILIVMAVVTVTAAFGDDNTVSLESVILESFDGDSNYEWKVAASKFATKTDEETFPKLSYFPMWPRALFGSNKEEKDLKILGIEGKFDRQGYNWIDVYPVAAGSGGDEEAEPAEIPIPGRVKYLDMWVWGSNLKYTIEAYVRDYRGVVHVIELGNIAYEGWKDLRVAVPASLPQSKRVLPRLASLSFVKFRIWTPPREQVGNFYVYFDQFKVLTDTFESIFDGDELADPEKVQELWTSGTTD